MRRSLKRSPRKIAALALAMVSCLSHPVFAEEKNEATVTREVIVTASRTEQELKETPTSAEIITREKIETLGAQTVRDALKLAFNIDVSSAGMVGNSVSIRGMDSTHTLILVDGRRVASEDTRQMANVYELDRINLDNVERIEIIRGSGSAIYGSDALGGVINIITKKSLKQEFSFGVSGGNRIITNSYRFDTGQQGRWSWVFDTNFQRVREKSLPSDNSNMFGPSEFYNLKGTYDLTDKQKIDIYYEKMNEHLSSWSEASVVMGRPVDASKSNYENRRDSFGLSYRGTGKKSNYELKAYYNRLEKDSKSINQRLSNISDFDKAKYETWVIEGRNSIQLSDEHLFTFGGEYRSTAYRGTRLGGYGDNPSIIDRYGIRKPISEREIKQKALYMQDEWVIGEKVILIPSLRLDDSDKFGSNWSPKLGVTYKLNDNYRLKANYGRAFRAPTISELYMDYKGLMGGLMNSWIQGNPNLKPEKANSWEISFEGEKNNNFGKITYFYSDVKNLINTNGGMGFIPGVGMGIVAEYENIDKARLNGIEMELGRHLNDQFTIKVAHGYLDAIDKTDDSRLDNRAKNRTTVQLHYNQRHIDGISAILWNEWVHDYRLDEKDYSYSMLNFSINKKWSNNKYSAYFAINNIFDKEVSDLSLYEGRVWRVGLNVKI